MLRETVVFSVAAEVLAGIAAPGERKISRHVTITTNHNFRKDKS
ncbi:MAG: hypothetical protein R3D97_09105 [Paracoccaceae bacterium]